MLILGHRGASAIAPENTVSALRAALDAGAAGSEFDVRMTTDGVCVCTHDAIVPTAAGDRRVCDLTAPELLEFAPAGPIPTLTEALQALEGSIVLAEIKNHPWDPCFDPAYRIADAVAEAMPAGGMVACFDPWTLARVRAARPDLMTAVITGAPFEPEANLEAALQGGHEVCSVEHVAVTPAFVARAHEHSKLVYAWATDDPGEVRRLAEAGVDALMCDDPARAIAAL